MAKDTGRKVRGLNQDVSAEITTARRSLYAALQSRDPVKKHDAIVDALNALDGALFSVSEIEGICALDAQRGSYNKD